MFKVIGLQSGMTHWVRINALSLLACATTTFYQSYFPGRTNVASARRHFA